jgi:NAD(P)H dehydrogenase (quinone)
MLRNSVYMDGVPAQARDMLEAGRAVVPANDVRMSYVTRSDCAEAAAAVLATPGHENTVYDITGPELLGTREIAAAAAAASGGQVDIAEGEDGVTGFGVPALAFVSSDFRTLTGRQPVSLRQLLEAEAISPTGR